MPTAKVKAHPVAPSVKEEVPQVAMAKEKEDLQAKVVCIMGKIAAMSTQSTKHDKIGHV
jgi:hypothetical protein